VTNNRHKGYVRKYGGVVVGHRTNYHGKTIPILEVTAPCARCTNDFTFKMTTKPEKFCPECKVISKREKRQRDTDRVNARKQECVIPAEPSRRKIPYAGFDPSEKH
jgi:hypothetical protein